MDNTLKIGLVVALVLVMSLSVAGCTSNNSTSNSGSDQALVLTATQIPVNDTITSYYGNNVIQINATITNNNAGTFKTSTDNFYLQDSSGHTSNPVNPVRTDVSDTGYYQTIPLFFTVNSGATPSSLRYYDGTRDISCSVSS
jgi:predicted small secreted protein